MWKWGSGMVAEFDFWMLVLRRGLLLFVGLCLVSGWVFCQKLWDGSGLDGRWDNAINWSDNAVPAPGEHVILDNSLLLANYNVELPAGSVTVESIHIEPGLTFSINLILPSTNTVAPALTVQQGIVIRDRGCLRNVSRAASGTPLVIGDSLYLMKNGRYVHATARSHTVILDRLARSDETIEGIFEFDLPQVSSTISISGRNFGSLVLSSNSVPGTTTYTGAGTMNLKVRSDLVINDSVRFNLNLSDSLLIGRHYIQNGGSLNVASNTRSLTVKIGGDMLQLAGIIEKTGTGMATLLFAGMTLQKIKSNDLRNQVQVIIDNPSGVRLESNLFIPYRLTLKRGVVHTTNEFILHLGSVAEILADSLSTSAYVEGRLRKEALLNRAHFLYPVGAGGHCRWLALKNVTGDFTVEFLREDPRLLSNQVSGIDHISALEYWKISTELESGSFERIQLSFADANQSGVTELSSLRVARLKDGTWENAGNSVVTGSAGANGSVASSELAAESSEPLQYFTIASVSGTENPLPVRDYDLQLRKQHYDWALKWKYLGWTKPGYYLIETAGINGQFSVQAKLVADHNGYFEKRLTFSKEKSQLRIGFTTESGDSVYSRIYPIGDIQSKEMQVESCMLTPERLLAVTMQCETNTIVSVRIVDLSGRTVYYNCSQLPRGRSILRNYVAGFTGLACVVITTKEKIIYTTLKLIR